MTERALAPDDPAAPDPFAFAAEGLRDLGEAGLRRFLRRVEEEAAPEVVLEGRRVICLCSNNYLGLANHPRLKRAAVDAVERLGCGAGASRLISGNLSVHEDLEREVARFQGAEAALLFGSGYHANTGTIPVLAGRGDLVLSDELNHASLIDGARLSRAEVRVYRHADLADLREHLRDRERFGRCLVLSDAVFSMDGDTAPLAGLCEVAAASDALVYLDEAHATGVLGEGGRGLAEHLGVDDPRLVRMGTLGKALGSFGAFVVGRRDLIELLLNRARSFVYSTGLPPAAAAAGREALRVVADEPERRERLHRNTERMRRGLRGLGYRVGGEPGVPILPVHVGDAGRVMDLAAALLQCDVLASGIRPPTVPEGTSRIRVTVMATHDEQHLERALAAFAEAGRAVGVLGDGAPAPR